MEVSGDSQRVWSAVKVRRIASEEVILQLLISKCIPILLYGLEPCPLRKSDLSSLDFVINRFCMKMHGESGLRNEKADEDEAFSTTLATFFVNNIKGPKHKISDHSQNRCLHSSATIVGCAVSPGCNVHFPSSDSV